MPNATADKAPYTGAESTDGGPTTPHWWTWCLVLGALCTGLALRWHLRGVVDVPCTALMGNTTGTITNQRLATANVSPPVPRVMQQHTRHRGGHLAEGPGASVGVVAAPPSAAAVPSTDTAATGSTCRIQIGGLPKSGTTWLEVVLNKLVRMTCASPASTEAGCIFTESGPDSEHGQ